MLIANTADLHFRGSALDTIGKEWHDMHVECFARGVDAIIVEGDTFDDPQFALGRDASAGDVAAALIEPIIRYEIQTIFLPGNHDYRFGHKSALEVLKGIPNVQVVDFPQIIDIHSRDRSEVSLAAILPWMWNSHLRARTDMRDLTQVEFSSAATNLRRTILSGFAASWATSRNYKILAGHAEVEGSRNRYIELPAGSTQVFSRHDLQLAQADAVVLGHIHMRQMDYVGSLVQHTFGEQDNPTGFLLIDTATGQREFLENGSPRHFTVDTWADYDQLEFRADIDRVKVREEDVRRVGGVTISLPSGVKFEKRIQPKEHRQRAEGVTPDSSTEELLQAWMRLRHPEQPVEPLLPALHRMLEHVDVRAKSTVGQGAVTSVLSVRLRNIGPHADTQIEADADGMFAIVGVNGAGKTMILEGFCGAVFGELPFYPGPLYDLTPEGFTGEALIESRFEACGRRLRARRELKITPATRSQNAYLFEEIDGAERPLAGPKKNDVEAELLPIVGDKTTFFATVFQGQSDSGSIIDEDPAERMAWMRRWVGADRYEEAAAWFKLEAARLRGAIDADERWLHDNADVDARIEKQAATLAEVQRAHAEVDRRVLALVDDERQAAERRTQILALRESRAQVAQRVQTLHDVAHRLAGEVAVARGALTRDERVLEREPVLREQVAELDRLRAALAEAQRAGEIAAAATAKRAALEAEAGRLQDQIDAVVRGALDGVQTQRREFLSQQRDIAGRIQLARQDKQRERIEAASQVERLQHAIDRQVDSAREDVARRRGELREKLNEQLHAIGLAQSELDAELRGLEREAEALRGKAGLLEGAGCKDAPLPCRFLADAASAPDALAIITAEIEAKTAARTFEDYAHAARAKREELSREMAAIADVDEATVAVDLRAELREAQAALAAIDQELQAEEYLAELHAERASADAALRGLQDPDPSTLAPEIRDRLAAKLAEVAAAVVPPAPDTAHLERSIAHRAGAERELGEIDALRRALTDRCAALTSQETALAAARADAAAAQAELDAIATHDEEMRRADAALYDIASALTAARRNLSDLAGDIGRERAALDQLLTLAGEVERRRAELLPRLEEVRHYATLTEAFGATGVPQLLIDCAIPRLNEILADMTTGMDEPVLVEFTTQRANKGQGAREGLFIDVTDGAGCRDIKRHSCGEQGFLRKIVRQAMGLYNAERHGQHHRVYFVDEPTLGLDERNVPRLLACIYRLTSRFRQVWVVSHDAVLLQGIPTHFRLDKVNGATVLVGGAPAALPQVA